MHYGCLATIIVYHQKRTTFIRDGSARSIHGWFRSAPLRCPATRCPQEEHKVGQTEECRCLYLCYQFKRLLRHNKCISLCSECISRVWGSKWPSSSSSYGIFACPIMQSIIYFRTSWSKKCFLLPVLVCLVTFCDAAKCLFTSIMYVNICLYFSSTFQTTQLHLWKYLSKSDRLGV